MQQDMELQQALYQLFKMQIQFGAHRCGDALPTIREASGYFMVSVDTIRLVYLRLKQEGYISLSTSVGARVRVSYSDEETQRHIQNFFAQRREPLLDLARSLRPLCSFAQWFALKNCPSETLEELERSCAAAQLSPVYRMLQQLQLLYRPLGNELFVRLMWQIFLFFQAVFLSVPHSRGYFRGSDPLLQMIGLCRRGDWAALWECVEKYQEQVIRFLEQFYQENIPEGPAAEQVAFSWSVYKKTSQICYSLCLDLLLAIRGGVYPVGRLLPTPARLAQEKKIALNTVRRTYALLNKLGAVRSENGVGTRVLPPLQSAANSDPTDRTLQRRLLDFAKGCQILALSCRACSRATLAAMDGEAVLKWLARFEEVEREGVYENLLYTCYAFIAAYAPYRAIRTIYAQLLRMLFWGFPLRDLHGGRKAVNAHFAPYLGSLKACLRCADGETFAQTLEELQITETRCVVKYLAELGLEEAGAILLPCNEI
ncbi:GntR family transcriptional regulator [Allofournierella sp.]|uniref:GntR family transcriptional regulator n=1 Tax=Allofournierella sp. TaxID=1940256 RepID=UPI003AB35610